MNALLERNTIKMYLLANKNKEIDNIRRTRFEFALTKSQITAAFYKCCKLYW